MIDVAKSTGLAVVATAVSAFIIGCIQVTVGTHGPFSIAMTQLACMLASWSVVGTCMSWMIAICDWIAWVMED